MFLYVECLHVYLVAVESHETGFYAEGASLVETSATGLCPQFAQVGDVHFAESVKVEFIQDVERACHEYADGS